MDMSIVLNVLLSGYVMYLKRDVIVRAIKRVLDYLKIKQRITRLIIKGLAKYNQDIKQDLEDLEQKIIMSLPTKAIKSKIENTLSFDNEMSRSIVVKQKQNEIDTAIKEGMENIEAVEDALTSDKFTLTLLVGEVNGSYEIVSSNIKGKSNLMLDFSVFGGTDKDKYNTKLLNLIDVNEDSVESDNDQMAMFFNLNRKLKAKGYNSYSTTNSYVSKTEHTREDLVALADILNSRTARAEVTATKNIVQDIEAYKELCKLTNMPVLS